MTVRIVLAASALALSLTACASGPGAPNSYQAELDRLTADCAERGGILSPNPGSTTGRPQIDFVCRISGGASRIN